MIKWEYLYFDSYKEMTNVVTEEAARFQEDSKKHRAYNKSDCDTLNNYLKLLGDNGWEMVSVVPKENSSYFLNQNQGTVEYRYFFKRLIQEE